MQVRPRMDRWRMIRNVLQMRIKGWKLSDCGEKKKGSRILLSLTDWLFLSALRMMIALIRPRHSIPYLVPIPNPIAISEHIMHLAIFAYHIHATDAQTAVIFRPLVLGGISFAESGVSESRGWATHGGGHSPRYLRRFKAIELGIRIGVGYSCASDAFPACWGNSEGRWEGFAAGPECWKREVPGNNMGERV